MNPKLQKLKIFGCPEGCRKKFNSEAGLNLHLTLKHNVSYKVKIDNGRAYTVRKLKVSPVQLA